MKPQIESRNTRRTANGTMRKPHLFYYGGWRVAASYPVNRELTNAARSYAYYLNWRHLL